MEIGNSATRADESRTFQKKLRFHGEEVSTRDGWCWFFGAIDHCVDELRGWPTAKIGDRWAALEPLRPGVRHAFGHFANDVARGPPDPLRLEDHSTSPMRRSTR